MTFYPFSSTAKNHILLLWGLSNLPLAVLAPCMSRPPSLFSVVVSEREENLWCSCMVYSTEESQYCWDFTSTAVNIWPITIPLQGKYSIIFECNVGVQLNVWITTLATNCAAIWIHQLLSRSQIWDLIHKGTLSLLCRRTHHIFLFIKELIFWMSKFINLLIS